VVKTILYKRTTVLGMSIDFRKDMRRSEPRDDSGGSGWRKEAVKTGGRIYNIMEKKLREILQIRTNTPSLRSPVVDKDSVRLGDWFFSVH